MYQKVAIILRHLCNGQNIGPGTTCRKMNQADGVRLSSTYGTCFEVQLPWMKLGMNRCLPYLYLSLEIERYFD